MLEVRRAEDTMVESLVDWFFRNLQRISIVVPLIVLLLLIIKLLRSLPAALRSTDSSFAVDFQWAHGNDSEDGSILSLLSNLAGVIRRWLMSPENRAYFCKQRWKIFVVIVIVAVVIGGAEVAFSRGDNEQKARTTALALPPPLCNKSGNTQLLIFIHGWNGDPNDTWKKFPELACADPNLSEVDVVVVNYPTFVKRRNLTIDGLAKWVNEEINNIDENQKYKKIAIVAHSMGGLIGREMAIDRKLGDQQSIGLLVEIGTPHAGADNARMASALGISKQLTEELMRNSTVLNLLTSQWFSFKQNRPQTFCFTSPQDIIVSEQSAWAFCDDETEYPMWGHTEMVKPVDASDSRYVSPMKLIHQFMRP
jgi:predicted alpha/beta hydrolase family esterase